MILQKYWPYLGENHDSPVFKLGFLSEQMRIKKPLDELLNCNEVFRFEYRFIFMEIFMFLSRKL